MRDTVTESIVPVKASLQVSLTEVQARELYRQGEKSVVCALLELTKQLTEARAPSVTPSTPSGWCRCTKNRRRATAGKT